MEIRPFTMADYDEAVAFWKRQDGVGLNESDERGPVAAFLERNPGMSFVAREDGALIGAVLCGHDGRRGCLHHLSVAPAHRGRGIGRRLVERCLDRLREMGIQKCNIFLYADNEDGEGFWKAIGFRGRADLRLMQKGIGGGFR